jgi:hypothetical protein
LVIEFFMGIGLDDDRSHGRTYTVIYLISLGSGFDSGIPTVSASDSIQYAVRQSAGNPGQSAGTSAIRRDDQSELRWFEFRMD